MGYQQFPPVSFYNLTVVNVAYKGFIMYKNEEAFVILHRILSSDYFHKKADSFLNFFICEETIS